MRLEKIGNSCEINSQRNAECNDSTRGSACDQIEVFSERPIKHRGHFGQINSLKEASNSATTQAKNTGWHNSPSGKQIVQNRGTVWRIRMYFPEYKLRRSSWRAI
jgi:hypothetical protein